jgi:hypothetical protein
LFNRKYSKRSPHCKILLRKITTIQATVKQTEEGEENIKKLNNNQARESTSLSRKSRACLDHGLPGNA